jgi:hypothetical protein
LERVQAPTYVADLAITANLTAVTVLVTLSGPVSSHSPLHANRVGAGTQHRGGGGDGSAKVRVSAAVEDAPGHTVATAECSAAGSEGGRPIKLTMVVPASKLWSPGSPFLYNLTVTVGRPGADADPAATDTVQAYFGMRTVALGDGPNGMKTLLLNDKPFFASGWLDQSWWPDGQYTAPTDDALAFDVQVSSNRFLGCCWFLLLCLSIVSLFFFLRGKGVACICDSLLPPPPPPRTLCRCCCCRHRYCVYRCFHPLSLSPW